LSATVIGDDELGAPFAQLFSPFKPVAKEATGSELTHTPPASKDPANSQASLPGSAQLGIERYCINPV
jgi:hypothetical protein